jgi:Rrf2 family protein
MQISTRTRYGSRAMAELALAYPHESVSVRELAEKLEVSAKYLEQIMGALKAAGLVEAERGMHGGYRLSRPPEQINLGHVFEVFEGVPAPTDCVGNPQSCRLSGRCPTRDTWVEITEAVGAVLEAASLRTLADRRRRKTRDMYQI